MRWKQVTLVTQKLDEYHPTVRTRLPDREIRGTVDEIKLILALQDQNWTLMFLELQDEKECSHPVSIYEVKRLNKEGAVQLVPYAFNFHAITGFNRQEQATLNMVIMREKNPSKIEQIVEKVLQEA